MAGWQIWVDRGGTFTDIVAIAPDGEFKSHKLLSENPAQYPNSAIQGIRDIMDLPREQPIPQALIEHVKIGTTVATNALLERKGAKTALITTRGFRDALKIATQNRPNIFALDIKLPESLYQTVVEIDERILVDGKVEKQLKIEDIRTQLQTLKSENFEALAIVLMHGWKNPQHELALELLAKEVGFKQISLSHRCSQTIKIIPRGDTCVADAYLTPVMQDYVRQIVDALGNVPLYFMQSSGALCSADMFHGKDAILSGPAGGIIGASRTTQALDIKKIIAFDMGGTSTDVAHYAGSYERSYITEVSGVRIAAPMMNINTVAAGGGSICRYQDGRFQVGPESAGAFPGPACYRNGGPLTVTDCNLILGKIIPQAFPNVFGPQGNQALDINAALNKISQIQAQLLQDNIVKSITQIAQGFLTIAVDNMANAVRKISTQKGHDLKEYTLTCFGGAGGQHACLMADSLGMKSVVIHPYAGVLSAFGIGLADQGITKEVSVQKTLSDKTLEEVSILADSLHAEFNKTSLKTRSKDTHLAKPQFNVRLLVKYLGSEVRIELALDEYRLLKRDFETQHMRQFGYLQQNCEIQIDAMVVSLVEPSESNLSAVTVEPIVSSVDKHLPADSQYTIHYRENLSISEIVYGPALIIEKTGTNVLEPGWNAEVLADYSLRFSQTEQLSNEQSVTKKQSRKLALDPVQLEIFNNLYMSVAEQMGEILARTAHSVNIRERLDFSCAIFNENGELIANAPHVPVHLGSMSHSVKAIISKVDKISAGDSYLINSPYSGGTHLPDLTLVSPLFIAGIEQPVMYFASRAHHADIGGITPGSMPAASKHINEEGILFDGLKVVENNQLLTQVIDEYFSKGALPARNIAQNIADLAAQQAANIAGQKEMKKILEKYGFSYIQQVTNAILDNGELAVKNALKTLSSGAYQLKMDSGAVVAVDIKINDQQAVIDFSQSSLQQNSNFNAPRSITDAAVIYVFRTLVDKNIPLNAGCMRPLKVIVNKGSMLDPEYPAAVVAGNVEVSQAIVTSLFLALGVQAASQTTMNNLSFGNHAYQYYETLAGGTGAGHNYHGTDAVHSHMTNSRLTDPEVLEQRYPVILRQFAIRQNSGGLGRFNGGNGLTRTIQFNQKMTVNILSNSRIVAPPGLFGGQAGKCGKNMLHTIDGNTTLLAENCELEVKAGESLTIKTPGGGAYGAYENL